MTQTQVNKSSCAILTSHCIKKTKKWMDNDEKHRHKPERKHSMICWIPDLEVCRGCWSRGGSPGSAQTPREWEREAVFYGSEKIITKQHNSIWTWEFWKPNMTQIYYSVIKWYIVRQWGLHRRTLENGYEKAAHQSFFFSWQ